MATEASLHSCASDPNFAIICSFLDQFAPHCGITCPTFKELQDMLEDTNEVSQILIDIHIKLLRKARKSFTADKWEKALAKFCHTYSQQDGWELERFGYKKAKLGVKVQLLKVLLETQFDVNAKFKTEVNKVTAKDLRLEPLGRDQNGFQYWCQFDKSSHVRIYQEDLDEETWELVACDRNGLVKLIDGLSNGEGQLELDSILNEDSTSQEIEKPITDTGQEHESEEEEVTEEEEEEVEEEEEEEEEEEVEDEEEEKVEDKSVKEPVDKILKFSKVNEIEKKSEALYTNTSPIEEIHVPSNVNEDKVLISNSSINNMSAENINSLTGVDLSIKSESKKRLVEPRENHSTFSERHYLPERNNILSLMSARFNEKREAEDLSINPSKKVKLNEEQPMMLVKKDIVVSEPIEEPVCYVTGTGSGADCQGGNISEEPEFSEVIEEPIQFIVGLGSGAECDVGNPRIFNSSKSDKGKTDVQSEPQFSEVIEEPFQYIFGNGSGEECGIGYNKPTHELSPSSSLSAPNSGIECSLQNLSLIPQEPKFSEIIEEPIMFVHGVGDGQDSQTGNPDDTDESVDDKSTEKKPKLWSIENICSSDKSVTEEMNQDPCGSQKNSEIKGVSSKMSLDNGPLKPPSTIVYDEHNSSKAGNAIFKPPCDVKPITESIPTKDKPPDTSCTLSEAKKSIVASVSNVNKTTQPKVDDFVSTKQFSNTESFLSNSELKPDHKQSSSDATKSSNVVQRPDNFVLNDPPLVTEKSNTLATISESDAKTFSEDKTSNRSSFEETPSNKDFNVCKSSTASSMEVNNISDSSLMSNLLSSKEIEKSGDYENKLERMKSTELSKDVLSCSSLNSEELNNEKSDCSSPSKNSNITNNPKFVDKIDHQISKSELQINKEMNKNDENNSSISEFSDHITKVSMTNENSESSKSSNSDNSNSSEMSQKSKDILRPSSTKSNNESEKADPAAAKKHLLLTKLIKVCLDKDTNSKDECNLGLKGQLNAKFNDLFSAKNLLEPSIKHDIAVASASNSDESLVVNEQKYAVSINLNEILKINEDGKTNECKKEEKSNENEKEEPNDSDNAAKILCGNTDAETKIKEEPNDSDNAAKILCGNTDAEIKIKEEPNDSDNASKILCGNTDAEIKIKEEPNDSDNAAKILCGNTDAEIKIKEENGESINKIEDTSEDKTSKDPIKIRKSRANSLNNQEVDVPSKIRKTDCCITNQVKRSSRRNSRSASQSDVKTVPEGNVENLNSSITKENEKLTPKSEDTADLKQEEEKIKIEETNDNLKAKNNYDCKNKVNNDIEENKNTNKELKSSETNDEDEVKNQQKKGFNLLSFSLEPPLEEGPVLGKPPDFSTQINRKRRNSRKLSQTEGDEEVEEDATGGKKPRLRAKISRSKGTPASPQPLQKEGSSSDEEDNSETPLVKAKEKIQTKNRPPQRKKKVARVSAVSSKSKGKEEVSDKSSDESDNEEKTIQSNKKVAKKKQAPVKKENQLKNKLKPDEVIKKENSNKSVKDETNINSDIEAEEKVIDNVKNKCEEENIKSETDEAKPQIKKGRPKKQRTLLGLLDSDLIHSKALLNDDGSTVRQSRRIAQIKIKEEAERRAIEEATMLTIKETKKKPKEEKQSPKKQNKKRGKPETVSEEEDESFKEPEDKKKGKKRRKKKGLKYDINKPWQSSSGSSSEEAEEEEEHFDEEEEEDVRTVKVVSDHEFSPESDVETEEEISVPIRRARTAKKADEEVKEDEVCGEDYPCKKCGQPDHPEWILLCDKCDSGYHASCLRPPLMLIPEGDWFCPPCQHIGLVSKLKETLRNFEKDTKKRENEELRKKRLAYVGISLANVLPEQETKKQSYSGGRKIQSESSEASSEESESSEDDDEEPVYQLRQRKAAVQANYRFNDYDDLINNAIQDEMEAVKGAGNLGRGKDIANIVEADKKVENDEELSIEAEVVKSEEEEQGENWRPPVVPKNTSLPSLRKKQKKLTDLDKQSDDDADSDEDFKGSSGDEDVYSSEEGDSDDSMTRKQPVRRSSRHRVSRIDREFINDSESSDEPRRKKTRRVWDSSSEESSDSTWGRRKRKSSKNYNRIKPPRSGKKKKKVFDSDSDRPRKPKTKRPKIKYGLSEDDDEPVRRTRGKKMSYMEVAGSDTEEEVLVRSRKLIHEEEEEFVPDKEEIEAEEEGIGPEEDEDVKKVEQGGNITKDSVEKETKPQTPVLDEKCSITKSPVPEVENKVRSAIEEKLSDEDEDEDEDEGDDNQVEEEEIEEEVEEEVEEEEDEEEEEEDATLEEPKNLVTEKVVDKTTIKLASEISLTKVSPPSVSQVIAKPNILASPSTTSVPKPVIKEEKEEKKEPTPAIRLVPSAKLLDPNKRRLPEENAMRGMAGGGFYRPQPMPPIAGRQMFRPRYHPDQQRYLYQPGVSHHQFYPGGSYYSGDEFPGGAGYDEQMDPNLRGGDEEGVFSGLVSYFSSQREDDIDS